jgi:hypothetical protein
MRSISRREGLEAKLRGDGHRLCRKVEGAGQSRMPVASNLFADADMNGEQSANA